MPLYKAELDKMLADRTISSVTGPTDWVNSTRRYTNGKFNYALLLNCMTNMQTVSSICIFVCNITEGKNIKKVRLDLKDLNDRYIRREYYYKWTIEKILTGLHNKKFFSVVNTKKGYWHVELEKNPGSLQR